MTVRASLRSATLSPLARPRGRLRLRPTVSIRPRPQYMTRSSPCRAAGLGAHSVGQRLTVTAAPTFDQHTPACHRSTGSAAHSSAPATVSICVSPRSVLHSSLTGLRRPQCRPRAKCDGCAYLRTVAHSLLAGPRPQCRGTVGQGLTVTAAPTPDPHSPVCHWSPGPARPQCRPRSNCDGVEHALCTGVLGSACAYGRKQRSPQHGAGGRRCGVVTTRCAGAPTAGPPTPSHPKASLRTTRALESITVTLLQ